MKYDDTNSGVLFKNEKKEKDSQPDYRGNINIEGTDCWLSAWIKTAKSGIKYMSLSVQVKEDREDITNTDQYQAVEQDDDDSGPPF